MIRIHIWPDGTYCEPEELSQMTHMSDDFATIETNADVEVEDIVNAYCTGGMVAVLALALKD